MEYRISDKLAALKPSAIREIFKNLADPSIISFAAGNPAPESFPINELRTLSADIFENSAVSALQYSTTEGYPALREALAKRNKEKFGIGRDGDMTIVTSGGQQGIELTCKTMCNEGDVVICENPTFIGALNAFRSNGAKTLGVDLTPEGIDTEKLEKLAASTPNAKILYVIPNFQNPTGITSTLENRKKVYEIAKKYNLIIIEDNPYGELRFAGEYVPPIKSFDEDGIVVYCTTFSKILSAGMRVGYVCGPEAIVQKMVVAKQVEDVHTNIFFQMLCYRYMTEYDMDAHIVDIQNIYRHKANLMLDCLDKYMSKKVTYTRPEGGLFLWATLPDGIDSTAFIKEALNRKVALVPGSTFNPDTTAPSSSFRLNYSTPSDENIIKGCEIIGKLSKEMFGE